MQVDSSGRARVPCQEQEPPTSVSSSRSRSQAAPYTAVADAKDPVLANFVALVLGEVARALRLQPSVKRFVEIARSFRFQSCATLALTEPPIGTHYR